ncbi:MAG: trimeric intracellular cation channel family protein [Variovorax sp.]|nr:MAG: trimeric intracellular cation channel family protein [Variovorax sp.]
MLYVLDLIGVAVFAVSGVLSAGRAGLDLLGVIVIASVTAVGGGTLRDLLLNRHPVFWIRDTRYLLVILASAVATLVYVRYFPPPGNALRLADALGLALFAITGAQIAESARLPPLIVVLTGTMTGAAGGVLRDVLTNQVPLLLRGDIYGSAAIGGITLYLCLQAAGVARQIAFYAGIATVVGLRLGGIYGGWSLPALHLPG